MITKEQLEKLYNKGLSMMEIAEKEKWPHRVVRYWMERYNIPRRSRSEATYVKRNPNGNPFAIREKLNRNEFILKGIGLGLYWGEGDKSQYNGQVRISNTDPYLIRKFKEFLIEICGVKEEKFRYYLIMFNDGNKTNAIKFWKNYLRIERSQLGKITVIPPQGKGTYKKKNQFGVLTISVSNKKLKQNILEMIKDIQIK